MNINNNTCIYDAHTSMHIIAAITNHQPSATSHLSHFQVLVLVCACMCVCVFSIPQRPDPIYTAKLKCPADSSEESGSQKRAIHKEPSSSTSSFLARSILSRFEISRLIMYCRLSKCCSRVLGLAGSVAQVLGVIAKRCFCLFLHLGVMHVNPHTHANTLEQKRQHHGDTSKFEFDPTNALSNLQNIK